MPRSPRPGRARSAGCPCVCPSMQMAQLPASPCPRGGASPRPPLPGVWQALCSGARARPLLVTVKPPASYFPFLSLEFHTRKKGVNRSITPRVAGAFNEH